MSDEQFNIKRYPALAIYLKHGDIMNEITFNDYLPPASDAEISRAEISIGSTIPSKMKHIYKKYNGGQPIPSYVNDEKNIFPINSFFSIDEMLELYNELDSESLPNGFSKREMLPFAYDPGSGIYAISLKKDDFHKVYFYVLHEKAEIFGVWSSFDEFIDSIVDDVD